MRIPTIKLISSTLLCAVFVVLPLHSLSAEPIKHHALSLVGEPKYKPGFKHFDYVNPDAPKGGRVRLPEQGSFESLNHVAYLKGRAVTGIGLIYDQLLTTSLEEPSAEYGLLAEYVTYPDDYSSATFKLRDIARWHDGKPVTAEDVIFSFKALTTHHPLYGQYYKNVTKVEKTGPNQVTFTFNVKNNRELPLIVGQLTILPKHYWTGTDKNGKARDIAKSTLEAPLGSGPYKVANVQSGKSITYERVDNYWGKDLPVNKGAYNFDQIVYSYFLDRGVALEAFKAGKLDFFDVYSSKRWATEMNFSAAKSGQVKRHVIPRKSVNAMQAFVFNTRRAKFSDPRVREAFDLVFDFEWSNKNLFYNQYTRLNSYFDGSELAATGLPSGRELEILKEFEGKVPQEVFTTEYKSPVNANSKDFRKNLRKALKLLKTAGWELKKGKLVSKKDGKPFNAEFMLSSPTFKRVATPYIEKLKRIGVNGTVKVLDPSQYKRRVDKFDFDIMVATFGQSFSPGNEQRDYWSTSAAGKSGSRNYIGIKNPVIDKLIDKIIFAKDRADLVAATRALDRVLLWNRYVVPQWYAPYQRVAFWDKFGAPNSLNLLASDCYQDCLKAAISKKDKIYTTDRGFLVTWWAAAKKSQ